MAEISGHEQGSEFLPERNLDTDFSLAVAEWATETFPQATPVTIASHLLREAVELYVAVCLQDRGIDSIGGVRGKRVDDIFEGAYRQLYNALNKIVSKGDEHRADIEREAGGAVLLLMHLLGQNDGTYTTVGQVARVEFERIRGLTFGQPDRDGVREIRG